VATDIVRALFPDPYQPVTPRNHGEQLVACDHGLRAKLLAAASVFSAQKWVHAVRVPSITALEHFEGVVS
jgi:hypothetical protein